MTKFPKVGLIASVLAAAIFVLTACTGTGDVRPVGFDDFMIDLTEVDQTVQLGWTGIDMNIARSLTIAMACTGGGGYLRDVGRDPTLDLSEIESLRAASITAAARVFNNYFPNVTINFFWPASGGDWVTHRTNFANEHGYHPHIMMSRQVPEEIQRGTIGDLTIFADDPVWYLMNPTLKRMMMVHDRIWALPFLAIPYGIYVNRTLAENQNLDAPPINWTMQEYIQFVSNMRSNEYYGAHDIPGQARGIWNTISRDFHYNLTFREAGDPFVRMDTQAQREVHAFMPQVARFSWRQLVNVGSASTVFSGGRSEWLMFAEGLFLTYSRNPFNISYAADPNSPRRVQAPDWDLYPRPASDWVHNHVGLYVLPIVLHNIAMTDGDPTLSPDEYLQKLLAWEFLRFFTFDLRAWTAKASTTFGEHDSTALDAVFPFTVGQLYWDMLDLFFQATQRSAFANPNRFPAFHYVMELWQSGNNWGVWPYMFPWYTQIDGARRPILAEWNSRVTGVGARILDPNWLDQIYVHLPIWDDLFNSRWEHVHNNLMNDIERWYTTVPARQTW